MTDSSATLGTASDTGVTAGASVYFGVETSGRICAVAVDLQDKSTREAVNDFLQDGLVIERGNVAEARQFLGKQWSALLAHRAESR